MFISCIIGLFSFVLMVLFVVFNQNCMTETRNALYMFLNSVFPTMFPFYVLTAILTTNPLLSKISKFFTPVSRFYKLPPESLTAIILGLLCGFPVGAKVTCNLYQNKLISKKEAALLASFTNNAGPVYVITIIGRLYLKSTKPGLLIWICLVLSSLISGLFLCKFLLKEKQHQNIATPKTNSSSLPTAITSGLNTAMYVGAVIVFFASVTSLLKKIPILSNSAYTALYSITELTGGLNVLVKSLFTQTSNFPFPLKTAIISAVTGWSGFCVHLQVCGILKSYEIKTKYYFIAKILQSFLAFILSFTIFNFI